MFTVSDAFNNAFISQSSANLWQQISPHYCVNEEILVNQLTHACSHSSKDHNSIALAAEKLSQKAQSHPSSKDHFESLLQEYGLENHEGVLLMTLAESLLRVPDAATADALITEIMEAANWDVHTQHSQSPWVNAATQGLLFTKHFLKSNSNHDENQPSPSLLKRTIKRVGEAAVRQGINQAMAMMGKHFVLGESIEEAIINSQAMQEEGYTYSFDMLGEAAISNEDAEHYFNRYLNAIELIGNYRNTNTNIFSRPSVSIKLSALCPRFEMTQQHCVMSELYQRILLLAKATRAKNIGLSIDAEEMDRTEITLMLFEKLFISETLQGYEQIGIAVQAYSKRALPVLIWLNALSREHGKRIPIRLVKGAYWDNEIKLAQQRGLVDYPVFTLKAASDVSYLVCAQFLFSDAASEYLYPQFATHNAHTVTAIRAMATHDHYEFQQLHGMGEALYQTLMDEADFNDRVRIYAPVGSHNELLPYLVRRLLENGSNSSFVHQLAESDRNGTFQDHAPLFEHPVTHLNRQNSHRNIQILLPADLFGQSRKNSRGINIHIISQNKPLLHSINEFQNHQWLGGSTVNGKSISTKNTATIYSPFNQKQVIGVISLSELHHIETAISSSRQSFVQWSKTTVEERARYINNFADLLEQHTAELVALCHWEAGKTLQNSLDEVREAVDFCRYYSAQALSLFNTQTLPSPTGELNELSLHGRGVFACISPWNFPLAIFTGQITAALVTGNTVIAKPAKQTSLIASLAIKLLYKAGIPKNAVQLLAGSGETIGESLITHPAISGVVFTGSIETAMKINLAMAKRLAPIAPLIAETGGQNVMIVDSTSLPEQVVKDVMHSAFDSAGQRCSALRVLYLQKDIAEKIIHLLKGAMQTLVIGQPSLISTDIGPVIDEGAHDSLRLHISDMHKHAEFIAEAPMPTGLENGYYISPVAFKITNINQLKKEHFGPILHIIEYEAEKLDDIIDEVNEYGYGLTLSIHTRLEHKAKVMAAKFNVGNIYINRDQVGAVVGVQPFGGMGLSGTGPKAGGPNYLLRFVTEKTITTNLTATGGNVSLLSLDKQSKPKI